MFTKYRKIFLVLAIVKILLILLMPRHAHAATVPVLNTPVANPVMTVNVGGYTQSIVPAGAPVMAQPVVTVTSPWAGDPTFRAPLNLSLPPAGTVAPDGTPSVARVTSNVDVNITAPQGGVASTAQAASADAMVGSGARAATMTATADLAVADVAKMVGGSLAATGAVAAGVLVSPEVVTGLLAASVLMQGYNFFKELSSPSNAGSINACSTSAGNGVPKSTTFYPDGTVTTVCQTSGKYYQYSPGGQTGSTPDETCALGEAAQGYAAPYGSTASGTSYQCTYSYWGVGGYSGGYASPIQAPPSLVSVPWNASNLNDGVYDSVAHNAVDALGWSIYSQKQPLPTGIGFVSPAMAKVISDWTVQSSTSTSTGSTTDVLARVEATVSPAPSVKGVSPEFVPPVVDTQVKTTTIVNGTPTQSSTSLVQNNSPALPTSVGVSAPSVSGSSGNPKPTPDLCQAHPEILACADITKVGDVVSAPLQTKDVALSLKNPVVGGALSVCPAPLILPSLLGSPPMILDIWRYPCQFAGYIQPINIAIASLFGIYIIIGGFKNG